MTTVNQFHITGTSIDDAVALLTASLDPDPERSLILRSLIFQDIMADPHAGRRFYAATEAALVVASGIIASYVQQCGDDPAKVVQEFALMDRAKRPR